MEEEIEGYFTELKRLVRCNHLVYTVGAGHSHAIRRVVKGRGYCSILTML
jgi:hypothetical protein